VFSGPAFERLPYEKSGLEKIVVTDTIPLRDDAKSCGKFTQLSVARLLGEAIKRIHHDQSISAIFSESEAVSD
ncbi:MAG TPA: ribose-phosphate pyrophosphokinase, partial [Pirellulaceae bacterium]|nr:ribose-phosphate pyrophosphokinase [Pirellulaceae bacterium]